MLQKHLLNVNHWYRKNFPYLIPVSFLVLISFILDRIPYLNLFAGMLSTVLIFVSLLSLWFITLRTLLSFRLMILSLFVVFLLFDFLHLSNYSETLGSVFYLFMFLFIIYSVWQKKQLFSS